MLLKKIYLSVFFLILIVGFFFRKNDRSTLSKSVDLWVCIAIGLITTTFFTTFPLTKTYTSTDSSVFLYIGKMMTKGYLPYVDLFDHKGIILYFIQLVGVVLTPNSYTGIWIIEAINIIITTIILYKISGLFSEDRIVRWLTIMTVVIMCGMQVWDGGNLTEEYALPWISYALYIFLRYFRNFEYKFQDIVILGIGCAIVSLLRFNMIAIWAAVMPLILIRMVCKSQWKEIGNCAVGFVIGLGIVYIPILIYFLCTNSLKEFIECYFVFNFAYSDEGTALKDIIESIIQGIKNQPYIVVAFFLSIWSFWKKREYLLNVWIFLFSSYFAYMSGRYYNHYGIILLPMYIAIVTYAFTNLYRIFSVNERISFKIRFPESKIMILGFIVAILGAFFVQYKWANLIREAMFRSGSVGEIIEYIEDNSDREDDVLIVGNDCKYYLLTDRYTENKYFYQNSPIKISDKAFNEFISEFESHPSDLIIVMGDKEEWLERDDNRGKAYHYLENLSLEGKYECQIYDDYYVYLKNQ